MTLDEARHRLERGDVIRSPRGEAEVIDVAARLVCIQSPDGRQIWMGRDHVHERIASDPDAELVPRGDRDD